MSSASSAQLCHEGRRTQTSPASRLCCSSTCGHLPQMVALCLPLFLSSPQPCLTEAPPQGALFSPPHLCSNPAPSYPRVYRAKSRGLCLATHDPGCPLGTDRAKNFLGVRGLGCAGRSPTRATPYLVSSLVHTGSGSLPQQVVRVPQVIDGALHLLPLPAQPPSA